MRAAIYARVSTAEQDADMQTAELREFVKQRRWDLALDLVDVGESGSKDSRPALDKLMAAARRRQVDVVVVYRFDRFARSLAFLVKSLEEFRALGIDFVSLHESVDTSTPNGRLVFGILGSVAEFERELIQERIKSGIAAARKRGKRFGRPMRVVDSERVYEMRKQRLSWSRISRELGISRRTAKRRFQGWAKRA
jgi:DNA invertase Pin-like site-specific DNA recombinase